MIDYHRLAMDLDIMGVESERLGHAALASALYVAAAMCEEQTLSDLAGLPEPRPRTEAIIRGSLESLRAAAAAVSTKQEEREHAGCLPAQG